MLFHVRKTPISTVVIWPRTTLFAAYFAEIFNDSIVFVKGIAVGHLKDSHSRFMLSKLHAIFSILHLSNIPAPYHGHGVRPCLMDHRESSMVTWMARMIHNKIMTWIVHASHGKFSVVMGKLHGLHLCQCLVITDICACMCWCHRSSFYMFISASAQ